MRHGAMCTRRRCQGGIFAEQTEHLMACDDQKMRMPASLIKRSEWPPKFLYTSGTRGIKNTHQRRNGQQVIWPEKVGVL